MRYLAAIIPTGEKSHMPTETSRLDLAAEWLEAFAKVQRTEERLLYEHLARGLANDEETLELAVTDRGQPPTILLAAVHYLLLKGTEHPLCEFYPNLISTPASPDNAYDAFRSFCAKYREPLRLLVDSRIVQTNEVGRCAYLCLVFGMISERAGTRPLSIIDVGASAGLHLLWDKYTYRYRDTARYGDPSSPVGIQSEFVGTGRPRFPSGIPEVVYRHGIDIRPLDVNNEDDALWLRALVWAEDRARAATVERAMAVAREFPVQLSEGTGVDLVSSVIKQTPDNSIVCVFHTSTLYQWTEDEREKFHTTLSAASKSVDLRLISSEGIAPGKCELTLTSWKKGKPELRKLAQVAPHGQWIEWIE